MKAAMQPAGDSLRASSREAMQTEQRHPAGTLRASALGPPPHPHPAHILPAHTGYSRGQSGTRRSPSARLSLGS